LKVNELITDLVPLDDFQAIYGSISSSKSIASIITYSDHEILTPSNTIKLNSNSFRESKGIIGIIGAGNFTKMTLLPAIYKSGASLKYIASSGGVTGTALAKKYNFSFSTTDYKEIINDNEVDLVMITTRHDQHASMVIESLEKNKNVFVEKPLAINHFQLNEVIEAYSKSYKNTLTVGFNRRFSPHSLKVKSLLDNSPINVIATMNAGAIPQNIWIHDMNVGGGRIIGEACHFIDLITFFTGSKVVSVCMNAMGINPNENTDTATILLKYENGSTGTINYFANGSKEYPKERIEVYSQDRTIVIDNFRATTAFGFKNFKKLKTSLDKGHKKQFELLINQVKTGGQSLIPINEIINTTQASFAAIDSLKNGAWIHLD
jgi:predicted dehydrogenase